MPLRIVSGGQTGADRAALDVALRLGLPVGGWCPAGRWAEDGPIPADYPLLETASADPAVRTGRNVREADATLVLARGPLTGGTALTVRRATEAGRPVLVLAPVPDTVDAAVAWIARTVRPGGTLNVAGPRESEAPGSTAACRDWLMGVLGGVWPRSGQGR